MRVTGGLGFDDVSAPRSCCIAFVPDMCVSASESVAAVAVKAPAVRRTYGMAVRGDGLLSQATRRFVKMLASEAPGAGDAR